MLGRKAPVRRSMLCLPWGGGILSTGCEARRAVASMMEAEARAALRTFGGGGGIEPWIAEVAVSEKPRSVIPTCVVVDLFLPSMPAQAGHPAVGKMSASRRVGISRRAGRTKRPCEMAD